MHIILLQFVETRMVESLEWKWPITATFTKLSWTPSAVEEEDFINKENFKFSEWGLHLDGCRGPGTGSASTPFHYVFIHYVFFADRVRTTWFTLHLIVMVSIWPLITYERLNVSKTITTNKLNRFYASLMGKLMLKLWAWCKNVYHVFEMCFGQEWNTFPDIFQDFCLFIKQTLFQRHLVGKVSGL